MIKQIPILFSTTMVLAQLDGRKTITRRLNGLKEINISPNDWYVSDPIYCHPEVVKYEFVNKYTGKTVVIAPPYNPGNILWVREMLEQHGELGLSYVADNEWLDEEIIPETYGPYSGEYTFQKIPSIHMPKWACRIWNKIVSVRLERLQDISADDALNEGVEYWNVDAEALDGGEFVADYNNYMWSEKKEEDPNYVDRYFPTFSNPVDSFRTLWQKINSVESWDANPWVWVVEFKVLSTTGKPEIA